MSSSPSTHRRIYLRYAGILLGALLIYFLFHHVDGYFSVDVVGNSLPLRYAADTLSVAVTLGAFYAVWALETFSPVRSRLQSPDALTASTMQQRLPRLRSIFFATSLHLNTLNYCVSPYSTSAKYMIMIALLTGVVALNRSVRG